MSTLRTRIGHVHLKVRDLERSLAFYRRVLGLEVTDRAGHGFAFLSGGDAHHELALQEVGAGTGSPSRRSVGLYHTAWEVPDREAFADAREALEEAGVSAQAVDHGISWALYFRDPDGQGVEIYLDRRDAPDGSERWRGKTRPLPDRAFGESAVDASPGGETASEEEGP